MKHYKREKNRAPLFLLFLVILIFSLDSSGFPDGWLCANIILAYAGRFERRLKKPQLINILEVFLRYSNNCNYPYII